MAGVLIPISSIDLLADPRTQSPVIVLHASEYRRVLPIWIDHPEARVIAMALDGVVPQRPLTHHLLKNVLGLMNAKVMNVIVSNVENGTFFAELKVRIGTKNCLIDARPSDAIALALLMKAPVFVRASVLEEAGHASPIPERMATKPLDADEIKKISAMLSKAQKREEKS